MEINFGKVSVIAGAIVGTLTVLSFLMGGAVWALEQHFDNRYLLIAESLEGKLLDRKRDLLIEKDKENPNRSLIDLYKLQIQELEVKIEND